MLKLEHPPSGVESMELAASVATRIGWTGLRRSSSPGGNNLLAGHPPGEKRSWFEVPPYHVFFHFLERDVLPWLRGRGWVWYLSERENSYYCMLAQSPGEAVVEATGCTPSEAFCNALLLMPADA